MSAWTIWFTGLPASGKTTLARALCARLKSEGVHVVILDSDEVRAVLTPEPTYTAEERDRFYSQLAGIAALLNRNDVNVIIAATAPRRAYREAARARLAPFAEVWVRCRIETCRDRDPKGLYARAASGEIATLPGAGAPYEAPDHAEVTIDTDTITVDQAVAHLLKKLPWLKP